MSTTGCDEQRVLFILSAAAAATALQETADNCVAVDGGGGGCFQYLLALHILTAADPGVAVPAEDPQRFVRFLAPYTSALGNTAAPAQLTRTSSGECPGREGTAPIACSYAWGTLASPGS